MGEMGASEVAAQTRRQQEPRELLGPERAVLELVVKLLDHPAALGDPEVDGGVERRPRLCQARMERIISLNSDVSFMASKSGSR